MFPNEATTNWNASILTPLSYRESVPDVEDLRDSEDQPALRMGGVGATSEEDARTWVGGVGKRDRRSLVEDVDLSGIRRIVSWLTASLNSFNCPSGNSKSAVIACPWLRSSSCPATLSISNVR